MVLTPQLLQAIKLLQMPNAELAAFVERSSNAIRCSSAPKIGRSRPSRSRASRDAETSRPTPPATGRPRRWPPTPTRSRSELGTEVENAFDADRAADAGRARRADEGQGLSATSWTGVGGGGGDERVAGSRGLFAAPTSSSRVPDPAGDDRGERSGRPHDRGGADRRARRGRLPDGAARGRSPSASARRSSGSKRCSRAPGARADRRLRPQSCRVSQAAAYRARPLRPGDAGDDRKPACARPARPRASCGGSAASTTTTSSI